MFDKLVYFALWLHGKGVVKYRQTEETRRYMLTNAEGTEVITYSKAFKDYSDAHGNNLGNQRTFMDYIKKHIDTFNGILEEGETSPFAQAEFIDQMVAADMSYSKKPDESVAGGAAGPFGLHEHNLPGMEEARAAEAARKAEEAERKRLFSPDGLSGEQFPTPGQRRKRRRNSTRKSKRRSNRKSSRRLKNRSNRRLKNRSSRRKSSRRKSMRRKKIS